MKLLLVGPAWVGDMIIAQALIEWLHAQRPGSIVDLVAPPATAPLGERLPGVRRTLTLRAAHGEVALGRRWRLASALRGEGYEQAIVLPNSFKSALLPWWAGIGIRTGWLGEGRRLVLNDARRFDPDRYPRLLERFLALGLPADAPLPANPPIPRLRADHPRALELARSLDLESELPVLGLCPGAEYGPAKRWPPRHFSAVAREFLRRGGAVWIFGSAADRAAGAAIREGVPPALSARLRDLTGRTTLLEALDLLALTNQVVTNDSGLMHVACALQRPVIALYGSTSASFTPPLDGRAEVLRLELPCSPCFRRQCPLGHLRCLNELTPDRVIDRLAATA